MLIKIQTQRPGLKKIFDRGFAEIFEIKIEISNCYTKYILTSCDLSMRAFFLGVPPTTETF